MTQRFADIVFTDSVKAAQVKYGTRRRNERRDGPGGVGDPAGDPLGPTEAEFIAERDSFYLATVSETGWPYVQHRGGPPGFLRVLGPTLLGFADFRGNLQYVSVGNAAHDDRAAVFLMDYPNQRRLKILGHLRAIDAGTADPALLRQVDLPDDEARVERLMLIEVAAFDWNCPQHITPRFTAAEVARAVAPLRTEVETLRTRLANSPGAADLSVLGQGPLALEITGMRQLTPRVRAYELRAPDGGDLPPVGAGAHLDVPVRLADGREDGRRYSIAAEPGRRNAYEIAVLREDVGSGGSAAVHRDFRLGLRLNCGLPGNDFSLHDDARPAVLIAGGIGITPIRSMALALSAAGRPFALYYAGRSAREMAYREELQRHYGSALHLYYSDAGQRLDLPKLIAQAPADAVFYCCGPARLIDAMRTFAGAAGIAEGRLRYERFVPAPPVAEDRPVRVKLSRSGKAIAVPATRSILDAVRAAGIDAPYACRVGTCRTCAVKVISGEPDHRDRALTEADRGGGRLMCICVSRARSPELVLDL